MQLILPVAHALQMLTHAYSRVLNHILMHNHILSSAEYCMDHNDRRGSSKNHKQMNGSAGQDQLNGCDDKQKKQHEPFVDNLVKKDGIGKGTEQKEVEKRNFCHNNQTYDWVFALGDEGDEENCPYKYCIV